MSPRNFIARAVRYRLFTRVFEDFQWINNLPSHQQNSIDDQKNANDEKETRVFHCLEKTRGETSLVVEEQTRFDALTLVKIVCTRHVLLKIAPNEMVKPMERVQTRA